MKRSNREDYAELLFLHGGISQKEIAERVGVSEQTVTKWKKLNGWEARRKSLLTTRHQQLARLYDQLDELTSTITERDAGKRYANSKEADTINKLTVAIRNLETEVSLSQVVDVFISFNEYIRSQDLDKAKEVINLQDAYVKTLLS